MCSPTLQGAGFYRPITTGFRITGDSRIAPTDVEKDFPILLQAILESPLQM